MYYDTSARSSIGIEELTRSIRRSTTSASSPCAVYLSPLRAFQSRIALGLADLVVIAASAEMLLVQEHELGRIGESRLVLALALTSVFLCVMRLSGLYSLQALQTVPRALITACQASFLGAIGVVGLAMVAGALPSQPALTVSVWIAAVAVGLVAVRLGYFALLGLFPAFFKERVLLIGDAPQVRAIHNEIVEKRCQPSEVVGYVTIRDCEDAAPYPRVGHLANIDSLSAVTDADRVVILGDGVDAEFLENLSPKLRATSFEVGILVPSLAQLRVTKSYALSRHNTFLLQTPPLSVPDRFLKRLEDLVLGSTLLIVSLPLMALIALAIRLESTGPAIFKQRRWGFNGKSFTVYKFRTMRDDAGDALGGAQAMPDDPRITPLGHLLRRTSLDELPQFFNVIRGDMSLIGPRPHAVAHNEYYAKAIDGYIARHHVRPGMSGWAQVNGCRGETRTLGDMQRRLDYDLDYIARWSILFDVYIFVRTIYVVVLGRNAY
jgi:putative colanic acid biosynthesis UDP-glucose lipid carrier transferase